MKLTHEINGQAAVLTLKGDFTSEHCERFREQATDRLKESARDFVLDMGDVEFVDSRGLESLLWLQERCGEQLGQLRLARVQPNVQTILVMTRLATQLDGHADVEGALRSLRI